MATIVQEAHNITAGAQTSVAATLGAAATAGNTLWVFVSAFNATNEPVDITSVTATGATFTETETLAMSGSSRWQHSTFLANAISGTPTVITATTGASSFTQIVVVEVAGLNATALDTDNSATATGTNPTGAAATATGAGLHLFGVIHGHNGAFTAGSGWSETLNVDQDGSSRFGVYSRTAAASVSQTPAVTQATSAAYAIIHTILANVGSGGKPTGLMLMGVGA